ncbi:MAG: hybrid sensor histidine kinase/response regulator, partial [Blastocatellia bacterium]
AGAIVIAMAGLAMAGWVFGERVINLGFSNHPGATPLGMTPDAALCFILCGIALWVLRESTGKMAGKAPAVKAPAEKFLVEAALIRASLIKVSDEDSEKAWEVGPDGTKDGTGDGAEDGVEDETGDELRKKGLFRGFSRRLAQLCASVAALIAVVVLAGYVFGWDASVGGWLAQLGAARAAGGHGSLSTQSVSIMQGRMAPSAAFAFLLNGVALTMLDVETRRGARPAQHLALIALALSLAVALMPAYQISAQLWPFTVGDWPEMTALTAGIFVALSIGVVCARPRSGLVSLLTSESTGGYLARRMLPATIVVPAALGLFELFGEKAGYFDRPFGITLLVLGNILFFIVLIWRSATRLHTIDTERETAEMALCKAHSDLQKRLGEQTAELMRANQDLWAEMIERERIEEDHWQGHEELTCLIENAPIGAHQLDPNGVILWANQAELDLLGYTSDEYIGHHISEFHADELVIEDMLRRLRQGENLDNVEADLMAKDGSIHHALISSNVFWKGDNVVYTRCFTRDITESKLAQQTLLESEKSARLQMRQLDAIYQASLMGIALVDTELRYVQANKVMGEMMAPLRDWIDDRPPEGPVDNLVGRTIREVAPRLADIAERHFRYVLSAGEPLLNVEVRAPLHDPLHERGHSAWPARERDWLTSYYPLKDTDGPVLGVNVMALDITAHVQAESRLREIEDSFPPARDVLVVLDSTPVMIWMSGADKVCNFFNQSWLDYTGRTMEQEMENGWAEGIHPDDFERCLVTYVEAFQSGREFEMEYRLRRHDGQYCWVLNHGAPRFNLDGTLAGYIGSCVDIHEHKEYEKALRSSEEFSRSIFESGAACIQALDLDGRLISMNRRGMEMMEIDDFSDCAGADWIEPWEAEGTVEARAAIEAARGGGEGHFTGSCKTAKGVLKWWDVIVSPALDRFGKPNYLVAISRDITEAKQIESERDELLSRERAIYGEAENANRLKDEFLATVSHELRAPLNAIQGWVKLLRDGRLKPDEAARALETIERSTRAQNRIISDLLDVSRIITGKLRLNARPLHPAMVIESAVDSLRPAAEAKEISIELELDSSAGPISGDSDRLRQIVWNLVSNAIKFSSRQGRVQVRLECVGEHVEITVSDAGAGIAPGFLPFVFDRFRQGDGSSTRRQGGLGLGLAIVRHLTEMHGGSVRAQSPGPDQGATFVVRLPLITQTQVKDSVRMHAIAGAAPMEELAPSIGFDPALMHQAPELGGLRVLAVDDDSDARDLIRTILTQCGAIVETANTIGQALAVFERPEEWQPELLISDIEMPEADGYQLIRKLREIESQRDRRIPAIALTARARVEDRLRSLSAGFQMHVTKPVEPAELLTIVASLAGRLKHPRSLYEASDVARQEAG